MCACFKLLNGVRLDDVPDDDVVVAVILDGHDKDNHNNIHHQTNRGCMMKVKSMPLLIFHFSINEQLINLSFIFMTTQKSKSLPLTVTKVSDNRQTNVFYRLKFT